MRQKEVLITGASGFIGMHLCERLLKEGAEVHAVYRTQNPPEDSQAQWWQADLSDESSVRGLFRDIRPDLIFHLASHVKGAPNLEHELPTFRSNLQSTVNLLTLAAEQGCKRMVITGSLAEPEPQNVRAVSVGAVRGWRNGRAADTRGCFTRCTSFRW